ncbi:hypothetical protein [Chamaesiphon polymorphus]
MDRAIATPRRRQPFALEIDFVKCGMSVLRQKVPTIRDIDRDVSLS